MNERLTGTAVKMLNAMFEPGYTYDIYRKLEQIEDICEKKGYSTDELQNIFRRLEMFEKLINILDSEGRLETIFKERKDNYNGV